MTSFVWSTLARGLLVVFVALLVGGAAYAFSVSQPQEYQATTEFAYGQLLTPELQVLGSGFGEPDIDEDVRIATEAARVNSFDVAEATARAAPELGYSANQIAARVDASPDRGTLVVVLTATANSPEAAERLASAYSNQYLKLVRSGDRRRAMDVEDALRQRLRDLPIGDREGVIGAQLRDQISAVDLLTSVGGGSPAIIEGARASSAPANPQTTRNVLFGLLFGVAVGVGLVALRTETKGRATVTAARDSMLHRKPVRDR